MLLSQTYVILAGGILTVLLARWLQPDGFGVLQLVLSMVAILLMPADLGISHSAARFVAETVNDRGPHLRGVLVGAGIMKAAIQLLVSAVVFVVAKPLGHALHVDPTGVRLGAALVFSLGFHNGFLKIFEGLQQYRRIPGLALIKNSGDLVFSVAFVLLGWGVAGALLGRVLGSAIAAIVAFIIVATKVYRRSPHAPWQLGRETRQILGYGSVLAIVDLGSRILMNADRFLINAFLGAAAVGTYSVPARVLELSEIVALSVAAGIAPGLAGRSLDDAERRNTFVGSIVHLWALYAFVGAVICAMGPRLIVSLLGTEYSAGGPILRVMSVALPLVGISPMLSLSLNYSGHAAVRAYFVFLAVGILVCADMVLIPRLGAVGAAVGFVLGQASYVMCQLVYCMRSFGIGARPLAPKLLVILVAGVLSLVAFLAVLQMGSSPWVMALLGIAIVALYATGLDRLDVIDARAAIDAGRTILAGRSR